MKDFFTEQLGDIREKFSAHTINSPFFLNQAKTGVNILQWNVVGSQGPDFAFCCGKWFLSQ